MPPARQDSWPVAIRRDGLSILHDPPDCQLDMVIIHGLNGSPYRTFRDGVTGFFWPQDLAKVMPKARIMLFGYIADISANAQNSLGVYQHADNLLLHLRNNRVMPQDEKRPIVFLAHSLGGIVVKQALVMSSQRVTEKNILQSTVLIFFLGTPHRGSHLLDTPFAKAGLSIMKIANREVPKNVKSILKPRADESFMVNSEFMRIKGHIEVVNFYEQVPRPPLKELVVDKDSAVFDTEYSENIPVARDHEHLVRFESENDDAYHTLCQTLKRKVTNALATATKSSREAYLQRMKSLCLSSLDDSSTAGSLAQSKEAHYKTLSWLWEGQSDLRQWLDNGNGLFSIKGKPGSGKSVLMQEVAKHIRGKYRHRFAVIVYHAFNARGTIDEHSFRGFLCAAIIQILRQHPSSFEAMLDDWLNSGVDSGIALAHSSDLQDIERIHWSVSGLKAALISLVSFVSESSPICFITDALDECDGDAEGRTDLLRFLEYISNPRSSTSSERHISICFSCRNLPSILGNTVSGSITMEERNGPDISAFINDRWSALTGLIGHDQDINQLKGYLIKKADGIFLWAHLALDRIQIALGDGATVAELREAIEDIPDELGGLFGLLLSSIDPKYLEEGNAMLAVAMSARRPLYLREFRHVMALRASLDMTSCRELATSSNVVQQDDAMKRRIRSRCGGLLEVKSVREPWTDHAENQNHCAEIVQFMHQSVKDYLLSKHQAQSIDGYEKLKAQGHSLLARCSIQYLSFDEVRELAAETRENPHLDQSQLSQQEELPLLLYAIEFCFKHCQEAEECGIPQTEIIDNYFGPEEETFQDYLCMRNAFRKGDRHSQGYSVLQFAIENNLADYTHLRLTDKAIDIDEALEGGQSYTQLAIWCKHYETLKVLLAHRPDLNHFQTAPSRSSVSYSHIPPLALACVSSLEMVQALLESGANISDSTVDFYGVHFNMPLVLAVWAGKIEIVQMIRDSDPVAFSHPDYRQWVIFGLAAAISRPFSEISLSGEMKDDYRLVDTDLETIRRIANLVYGDADLYRDDFNSISACALWLYTGCNPKLLHQLAELGTDFCGVSHDGISFMHAVCLQGSVPSLQLLLHHHADPHLTFGPHDISCLQLSLSNRSPAILSYLLQIGLPIDEADQTGTTALHDAAENCTAEFINILLQHGASRSLLDAMGRRPFHRGIHNRQLEGHIGTLEKLQYQDSDIHLSDIEGCTPLHIAAKCSSLLVMKWLIRKGAQLISEDDFGRTVLHMAAGSGSPDSTEVLTYLLDNTRGLDVNARDGADMTALHHVFQTYGMMEHRSDFDPAVTAVNARLLVHRGANLHSQDNAGNTVLHLASWRGIEGLVRFFLRRGADPDIQDKNGLRPLDLASKDSIRELLEVAMEGGTERTWPYSEPSIEGAVGDNDNWRNTNSRRKMGHLMSISRYYYETS